MDSGVDFEVWQNWLSLTSQMILGEVLNFSML